MGQPALALPTSAPVLGRYRPVRPLGSGGSGSVWLAHDDVTGDDVALKMVAREGRAGARAEREAEASARLLHPNCLRAHDLGHDARHVYIVYEYVPGRTLREAMRAGALDDAAAIEAAAQILDGLAHAHARGVVHRDIKPANVILAESEGVSVRILDFGLAVLDHADTLTASGDVPGTLAYVPPERLAGQEAAPASDVWAVGVLLWEALAGGHPFWKSSLLDAAKAIQAGAPPLGSVRPDLPKPLLAAVDRALALDPAQRPAAAELAELLRSGARRSRRAGRSGHAGGQSPARSQTARSRYLAPGPVRYGRLAQLRTRGAAPAARSGAAGVSAPAVSWGLAPGHVLERVGRVLRRGGNGHGGGQSPDVSVADTSLARHAERWGGPAVTGLAAGLGAAALPFYPGGWAYGLGLAVAATSALQPRLGLALALAAPVLPLGNLSLGLALAYAAAAAVWLAIFTREPRWGGLPALGPLLGPIGALALAPAVTLGIRSPLRRAAAVAGIGLAAAGAAGLRGSPLPLTGEAPPAGLAVPGEERAAAVAETLAGALAAHPGLLAALAALAAAAAILPLARRYGPWAVTGAGAALVAAMLLPFPGVDALPVTLGMTAVCALLVVPAWRSTGGS